MALTETQTDTVFEILEVPRSNSVDMPVGNMGITGQTYTEGNSEFKLQLKIESRITALSSAQETRLIAYGDQWEAIGTQVYTLDGGTGGIDGITYNPADELNRIQQRVKRLVGVYAMIEEIEMENSKGAGGGFVPVLN
jgi:hypothetical protein